MAKRVQHIRAITATADAFVGLDGEVTVDTTKVALKVHDGITPGGITQAREDLTTSPAATPTSDGKMSAALAAKLNGIEAGAEQNPLPAEIKVDYESNADTNAFTDAEKTKLGTVETNAAADQTGAEIVTAYEGEVDTWQTGSDRAKLDGIAAGSEVNPPPATSTEILNGIETAERVITPDELLLAIRAGAGFIGETKTGFFATIPTGWLLLDGRTIGNISSGATLFGAVYEALFTALWNRADATASWDPIVGGKGVSAAADWAGNKQLTMPDHTDKVSVGSGTTFEPGDTGGAVTVTLNRTHLPATLTTTGNSAVAAAGASFAALASGVGGASLNNTGGDQPHENMPPYAVEDKIIKYA